MHRAKPKQNVILLKLLHGCIPQMYVDTPPTTQQEKGVTERVETVTLNNCG